MATGSPSPAHEPSAGEVCADLRGQVACTVHQGEQYLFRVAPPALLPRVFFPQRFGRRVAADQLERCTAALWHCRGWAPGGATARSWAGDRCRWQAHCRDAEQPARRQAASSPRRCPPCRVGLSTATVRVIAIGLADHLDVLDVPLQPAGGTGDEGGLGGEPADPAQEASAAVLVVKADVLVATGNGTLSGCWYCGVWLAARAASGIGLSQPADSALRCVAGTVAPGLLRRVLRLLGTAAGSTAAPVAAVLRVRRLLVLLLLRRRRVLLLRRRRVLLLESGA